MYQVIFYVLDVYVYTRKLRKKIMTKSYFWYGFNY